MGFATKGGKSKLAFSEAKLNFHRSAISSFPVLVLFLEISILALL